MTSERNINTSVWVIYLNQTSRNYDLNRKHFKHSQIHFGPIWLSISLLPNSDSSNSKLVDSRIPKIGVWLKESTSIKKRDKLKLIVNKLNKTIHKKYLRLYNVQFNKISEAKTKSTLYKFIVRWKINNKSV